MYAPRSNLPARASAVCPACAAVTPQRFMYRKNECDVVACEVCGLGRAVAADFDPARYYNDDYFDGGHVDGYADYAGSEAVLRAEFKRTVRHLTRFVPSGRLLEVGCAYGFFLLEAQRRFAVWGIELARGAVESCHQRGLTNVRRGAFDAGTVHDLPCMDAIVLLDVMEHLPDPNETFRLLAATLAPGGVVLLTTGDWNSPLARVAKSHWRLMTPPQHLFFFTPRSLKLLGARYGLTIAHISRPWKTVPLSLIFHQLHRMLGIRLSASSRAHALGRIGIPVNLFDAVRVVYRKT